MNRKTLWSVLAVVCISLLAACGGNGNSTPPPVETITVSSGSGQTTVVSTGFTNPLVALVETGTTPNAGVVVTFTIVAGAGGASATFPSGASSAMATTGANGLAQSPAITANATVGAFTVTAAASGVTTPATFSLTNTAATVASSQFTFFASGENYDSLSESEDSYSIAGTVVIDANGNVDGGEQDFNDGDLIHSPSTGDTILSGTLIEDQSTGQGTLTVVTNNANVGVNGTETFGVQFVNPNHALLIQFDGSATSSGSLDLQTLPAAPAPPPSGSFAFTITGVDVNYNSVVAGGVFTVSGSGSGNLTAGFVDANDAGTTTFGTQFSGTMSAPDGFGRGTITNTIIATTIAYYVVGPEAIRLIDIDNIAGSEEGGTGTLSGSAFGQGDSAGGFSNMSLGASVFSLESNWSGFSYAAVGEFSTTAAPAIKAAPKPQGLPPTSDFNGYGDVNEDGAAVPVTPISGTYGVESNGYGGMTFTVDLGDISVLGIYMVDPNLNIQDPNNTTTGLGGALVAELDGLVGIGIAIPQTPTSGAPVAGDYALGAQAFDNTDGEEVDFVGQGTISSGVLTGTGLLNDPAGDFGFGSGADVTLAGTAVPDTTSGATGRYTMSPLALVETNSGGTIDFDSVVIYEANVGQLFMLNEDESTLFGGTIQQQPSLPITPALKKAKPVTNLKLKPNR
jgi:hypothetical protein